MLGSLQTLTENKDEVFELARVAMAEPRFEESAMARVKAQILAGLKYDENDPSTVRIASLGSPGLRGSSLWPPDQGEHASPSSP